MKVSIQLTIILLGILTTGCATSAEQVAPQKPWSRHCSAAGIPARNAEEFAYLEAAATRCEPKDACVLACSRTGCADNIGGGCAHACFRGLPEDLAKRAESWSQMPSCRLPPNNSFNPMPLRGTG